MTTRKNLPEKESLFDQDQRMEDFYLAQPSKIVNKYTADNPKQKTLKRDES